MANVSIKYRDQIIAEAANGTAVRLLTKDHSCDSDIDVTTYNPDETKPIKFFDYDGTLVYSYTVSELNSLSSMPNTPEHDGLTSQGWNWMLEDAKAYATTYGRLIIGSHYITSNGKTRIYISLEKGRTSPYLGLAVNGTVDVDWGDGSAHDIITGTSNSTPIDTLHNYPLDGGNFIITLDVTEGNVYAINIYTSSLNGSRLLWANSSAQVRNDVYRNSINKIELGNNFILKQCSLYNCFSLKSITVPNSNSIDWNYVFEACYNLNFISIPDSCYITQRCFENSGLKYISLPKTLYTSSSSNADFNGCSKLQEITFNENIGRVWNSTFTSCVALKRVIIPNSATSIGNKTFSYCQSLSSLDIPENVTSFDIDSFYNCYGLGEFRFRRATPPTAKSGTFGNLSTNCVLLYPFAGTIAYKGITSSYYPSQSSYLYLGYYSGSSGETLQSTVTDGTTTYDIVWYASIEDAKSSTNPITVMQGEEVYSVATLQVQE